MSVFNVSINGLNGNPEEAIRFLTSWLGDSNYDVTEISFKVASRTTTPDQPTPTDNGNTVTPNESPYPSPQNWGKLASVPLDEMADAAPSCVGVEAGEAFKQFTQTPTTTPNKPYTRKELKQFKRDYGITTEYLAKYLEVPYTRLHNWMYNTRLDMHLPADVNARFCELVSKFTQGEQLATPVKTTNKNTTPDGCLMGYDIWHFKRNVSVRGKDGLYTSLSWSHLADLMTSLSRYSFSEGNLRVYDKKSCRGKTLPERVEVALREVARHITSNTADFKVTTVTIPQETLERLGMAEKTVSEEILNGLTEFADDLESDNLDKYKKTAMLMALHTGPIVELKASPAPTLEDVSGLPTLIPEYTYGAIFDYMLRKGHNKHDFARKLGLAADTFVPYRYMTHHNEKMPTHVCRQFYIYKHKQRAETSNAANGQYTTK